jgi:hypothetical protein
MNIIHDSLSLVRSLAMRSNLQEPTQSSISLLCINHQVTDVFVTGFNIRHLLTHTVPRVEDEMHIQPKDLLYRKFSLQKVGRWKTVVTLHVLSLRSVIIVRKFTSRASLQHLLCQRAEIACDLLRIPPPISKLPHYEIPPYS